MELLFVVEATFALEGVGLVLGPGVPPGRPPVPFGAPLFLVRPDGTHVTALAQPLAALVQGKAPGSPVAVALSALEVPPGTRVFGRASTPGG